MTGKRHPCDLDVTLGDLHPGERSYRLRFDLTSETPGPRWEHATPGWVEAILGKHLPLLPTLLGARERHAFNLRAVIPPPTPLLTWLRPLSAGRRRWHATRAAALVALFLEQWRDTLEDAGVQPFVPPLRAEHLCVDAANGQLWIEPWAMTSPARDQQPWLKPPEGLRARAAGFDRAAAWTVGVVLRGLLDPDTLLAPHPLTSNLPNALKHRPPLPTPTATLLNQTAQPLPSNRPALRDLLLGLLGVLSVGRLDCIDLSLNDALGWLRSSAFEEDLTEISLLCALRPDLISSPIIQDYIQGNLAESMLTLLRRGAPLSSPHEALLRLLPGLQPHLLALFTDPDAPLVSRITAADLLGGRYDAEVTRALIHALNDPTLPIAHAARDALKRGGNATPVAFCAQRGALHPCALAWDDMTEHPGSSLRPCERCERRVARADALDALYELPEAPRNLFTEPDSIELLLNTASAQPGSLRLRDGESVLFGSADEADLLVWDAAARHAWLTFERGAISLIPIDGSIRTLKEVKNSAEPLVIKTATLHELQTIFIGSALLLFSAQGLYVSIHHNLPDENAATSSIPPLAAHLRDITTRLDADHEEEPRTLLGRLRNFLGL